MWNRMLITSFLVFVAHFKFLNGLCPVSWDNSPLTSYQLQCYPSIEGADKFVMCSPNNEVKYSCPTGFKFNPRASSSDSSPLCISLRGRAGFAFNCPSGSGNGSYSGDPSLYVTCNDTTPISLHECPTPTTFSRENRTCGFNCVSEGIFDVTESMYYVCRFDYQSLRYIKTEHQCEDNRVFDRELKICVPSTTTTDRSSTVSSTTATSKSTSTRQPTTTADPSNTPQPTAATEPATTDDPTSPAQPVTTAEPATNAQPGTTDDPTSTAQPVTTSEPTSTEQPVTTSDPTSTAQPITTTVATSTAQPVTTPDPTSTAQPVTTAKPTSTTTKPPSALSPSIWG